LPPLPKTGIVVVNPPLGSGDPVQIPGTLDNNYVFTPNDGSLQGMSVDVVFKLNGGGVMVQVYIFI